MKTYTKAKSGWQLAENADATRLTQWRKSHLRKFAFFCQLSLQFAFLGIVCSGDVAAQTTLSVGDLQLVGVTSDDPDSFTFVLWKDIAANTVVRFTDNGFTSSAGTTIVNSENDMSLTFSSAVSAGSLIYVENAASTLVNGGTFSGSKVGSLSGVSSSGDQVFAYQGSALSGTDFTGRTLLYGTSISSSNWITTGSITSNTSYLPTAISSIDANLDVPATADDNADYNGTRSGMTVGAFRAAIANTDNLTASDTRFNLSQAGFTTTSSVNLTWDGNGKTAGTGGSGTWDLTTQSRFSNTANTTFLHWVNSSTGNDQLAVFAGTAGTVSVAASGVAASGLTFDVTGYTVQSNTITLAGSTPTITVTTAGHTATVDSALAGSAGVTKSGAGTLVLGGVSSYAGDTNIRQGTLQLGTGNNRLPTGTTLNVGQASSANLGTFDLNGRNQQIAGLNSVAGTNATASNNTVTSGTAATLTIDGSGTYSYGSGTDAASGVITGAISVVKQGAGTQTFGDSNTYTGTTTVSGGTLLANNTPGGGSSATGSGNITVGNTGTLGGTGAVSGVSGTVNVQDGGKLAPGDITALNTIESLDTGALTFGAGTTNGRAIFAAEFSSALLAADSVKVSGALIISSDADATIAELGTSTLLPLETRFTLASYTLSGSSGTFFSFPEASIFTRGLNTYQILYDDPDLSAGGIAFLTITTVAVPEASAFFYGGLITSGICYWKWRQKRRVEEAIA